MLNGPSARKTASDRFLANAGDFGPFYESFRNATQRKQVIVPFVAHLGGHRDPSTVVRTIGSIRIDSIEGMMRTWAWPHIKKELIKAPPTWVNGDAASTVIVIVPGVGVRASSPHRSKNAMLIGVLRPFIDAIVIQISATATALTHASLKTMGCDNSDLAAATLTGPVGVPLTDVREMQDCELSKWLILQIFDV